MCIARWGGGASEACRDSEKKDQGMKRSNWKTGKNAKRSRKFFYWKSWDFLGLVTFAFNLSTKKSQVFFLKKIKIYFSKIHVQHCTWSTISLQSMQTERREPSSLSLSPARGDTMLHLLLVLKHHPLIWLDKTGKREPSSLSISPARGDTMFHLLLVLKHHPVIWLDKTEKREPSSLSLSPASGDVMLHLLLVLKHHPVIWLDKTKKREPSSLSL